MIWQQAIAWAKVDPVLCRHIVSLGQNEITSMLQLFRMCTSVRNMLNLHIFAEAVNLSVAEAGKLRETMLISVLLIQWLLYLISIDICVTWNSNFRYVHVWHLHTTVYPKKYAHGFCFVVLCCGYTLTDFPISIRLTSLALWQSNDCPSASKANLMNMDKYFMWIH